MMPAAGTETGGTFTLDMDAPSDMIETVRHMMDETGIPYHEEPSWTPAAAGSAWTSGTRRRQGHA